LIAKRFGQELDRTALHGPNRHRNIGMAADEDNRQAQLCLGQLLLKLEPALSRQPDVEDHAPGEIGRMAIDEFLDRGKCLDAQSYGSQQPSERIAYIRIVVNDDDNRPSLVMGHDPSRSSRRLQTRRALAEQAGWQRWSESGSFKP